MPGGLNTDVYQKLRRLLVLSQIPAGQRLAEMDWAGRLQANRSAVREAMMALANEGLLTRGDAGGYFVPRYDQQTLDLILEARLVIESGVIRLLAQRHLPDEAWQRLDEVCVHGRQMLDNWYEFGFVEADRRFHLTLVELADNPRLLAMYRNAPLPLLPNPEVDHERRRKGAEATLADHDLLVAHLRHGRFADAAQLLERHLRVRHRAWLPIT